MKKLTALITALALLLSGCAAKTELFEPTDIATEDEIAAVTEQETEEPTLPPPSVEEQAAEEYESILSAELKEPYVEVEAEEMNQFPELPAGCESVALTIAINHYGYELEKTDIADDYLIYGDNFVYSYVGDPTRFGSGAGIYPPGLVNTVWNFVADTGARLYPIDTTALSLSELLKFIQAGYPVVVWTTYYNNYPVEEGGAITENDITYQWFKNEHCVTLYGYDLDDETVMISDPVRGKVTLSFSSFESTYDGVGQFSMVMLDTSGYDYPSDWTVPYQPEEKEEEEEE